MTDRNLFQNEYRRSNIPDDRPLTLKEFENIKDHALKSSSLYATKYVRTEKQVVEKLLSKGYRIDDVQYVDDEGVEHSFNIIGFVVETLRNSFVIDDENYAQSLLNHYSNMGKGGLYIRQKLIERGVSVAVVDDLMEKNNNDDKVVESIEKIVQSFKNKSTYLKAKSDVEKDQKVKTHLLSRGYSFGDISLWINSKSSF